MFKRIKEWFRSERGQDALEYALLGGLIAVVILVGVGLFGVAVNDWFTDMATEVGTWAP
jgi:pilus assembly protein Flp/PilA